jgi:hypothetical protein
MLLRRQEFAPRVLAALGHHDLADLFVREAREGVQTPPEIGIGYGLDVEHQSIHAGTLTRFYA